MDSFGRRTGGCVRCRSDRMAVCSLLLILICLLQDAQALTVVARVSRLNGNRNLLQQGQDYSVLHGNSVRIFCYCNRASSNESIRTMELRRNNDIRLKNTTKCGPLQYNLNDIDESDIGPYQCVTHLANGTFIRVKAGHLHIIDPSIVDAPPHQFGLLNDVATLNCSVNYTSKIIEWFNNTERIPAGLIRNIGLHHEGQYMCKVHLYDQGLTLRKDIQFTVIVPPRIVGSVPPAQRFTRQGKQSFAVRFESKTSNETLISWFKDGASLQGASQHFNITTTFTGSLTGETRLTIPFLGRRDKGVYRVVIENPHGIIPENISEVETQFTVDVSILPVAPASINDINVTDTSATLVWSYPPNITPDESADNQTITVHNGNSVLLSQVLEGTVRSISVPLIPAEEYSVEIAVANQDGQTTSNHHLFRTSPGAPLLSEISIRRNNLQNNTLNVTATVEYTGGSAIELFVVSYREIGTTTPWIPMDRNFTARTEASSPLVSSAIIVDDAFKQFGIELQVKVVNNRYVSNCVSNSEDIVIPGAPFQVVVLSYGHDRVELEVILPSEGTLPLTHVEVELYSVSEPEGRRVNTTLVEVDAGDSVQVTLVDLQEGTIYNVSVAVYNYRGKGNSSQSVSFTTVARPPLPVFGIALVGVGGVVLLVAIVILILLLWKKWSLVKHKARRYSVSQAESNPLPSGHIPSDSIVKHGKGSPLSPVSATPPTPSTATSVVSHSPPGFYPTPPYCSASTSHLSRVPPGAPLHHTHAPPSSFKFDAGSSRSTSENQDSDLETNSPRYTYTFPRSGEGTPQSSRSNAYDQVDLPLEDVPMRLDSFLMSVHNQSHEAMKGSYPHSRVSSAGTARSHKLSLSRTGYSDSDSSQFRTQSCHSVATTHTALTCSDTMSSTRDTLPYQPNSTAV